MTDETERELSYTFNWRKLREHNHDFDGFLKWMIVNLVTRREFDAEWFERVRVETRDYTDVTLTIQINGIETDVREFVEGMYHNMHHHARQVAADLLRESTELRDLTATVDVLQSAVKQRMLSVARGVGLGEYVNKED